MLNQIEKNIAGEIIIKAIESLFWLGKDTVSGGIKNLFGLGKDKILKDKEADKGIKDEVFEPEKDYYQPIRTGNAFSSNYIEYESDGDKDKILSVKDYLDKIEPNLNDLIDNHKTHCEWKIQLTMKINFISSKDSYKTHTMHTKSDNVEIMMGSCGRSSCGRSYIFSPKF